MAHSQFLAVLALSLRSLPGRATASAVAVAGVAGVVAVVVAVLSIAEGFAGTLARAGADDLAIVMRAGATSEMVSGLDQEAVNLIAHAPGVARDANGLLASAELFVVVDLPKRGAGTPANVPLRGVEPVAFTVRGDVEIVEGRSFQPGSMELVAGRGAAAAFAGLEVGRDLVLGSTSWRVVGIFEAGGSLVESELWSDVRVLQAAYRRGNSFQTVYARLESPEAFDGFQAALAADPRLNVSAQRTSDYFAEQSMVMTGLVTVIGTVIGLIMGAGAVFGSLNTAYAAVSARTREIATLRALGFAGAPVAAAVVVEAMLLGVVGGALGGGLAWLAFDGFRAATMNWQSFSQVTFAFAVTPDLLARGIAYALVIGLVGGLPPAVRAARAPVAGALREL